MILILQNREKNIKSMFSVILFEYQIILKSRKYAVNFDLEATLVNPIVNVAHNLKENNLRPGKIFSSVEEENEDN